MQSNEACMTSRADHARTIDIRLAAERMATPPQRLAIARALAEVYARKAKSFWAGAEYENRTWNWSR